MSFANLGALPFILGAFALAAALFALQRLRVRHRDVHVPTTLFWREAVEESRAKTLVERFRHLWAYLLALLIALLLWTAFGSPQRDAQDGVDHLVLVDASAGMAVGDRFARALEATREIVDRLPRASTTVRLCGAAPTTVLLPNENANLCTHRLRYAAPDACPSTIDDALHQLPHRSTRTRLDILVVGGDEPGEQPLHDVLPPNSLLRAVPCAPGAGTSNGGITALGVTEAASGRYDACDVYVEARGATRAIEVVIGDAPPTRLEPTRDGNHTRFELRDIATDGALLVARFVGDDALVLDDSARLHLPRRRILRIRIADGTSPALRRALEADSGIRCVNDGEHDVFAGPEAMAGPEAPALITVPMTDSTHAITIEDIDGSRTTAALGELCARLGLDQVDWMEIATQANREVSVGYASAMRPAVRIWSELLTERFDFTRSRAFPIFVAAAIRRLANEPDWHSWIAAGEPMQRTTAAHETNQLHAPLGARFVPPQAADYGEVGTGSVFAASLLDPASSAIQGPSDVAVDDVLLGSPFDWTLWLAVVALGLLVAEWWLHRTGRMP